MSSKIQLIKDMEAVAFSGNCAWQQTRRVSPPRIYIGLRTARYETGASMQSSRLT